jgi:hypothetical protein
VQTYYTATSHTLTQVKLVNHNSFLLIKIERTIEICSFFL